MLETIHETKSRIINMEVITDTTSGSHSNLSQGAAVSNTATEQLRTNTAPVFITNKSNVYTTYNNCHDLLGSIAISTLNNPLVVTFYDPYTEWNITNDNISNFWINYCDLVERSHDDPLVDICVGEQLQDVMPIISELIFKFDCHSENNNEFFDNSYDERFLQEVCHIYQLVIEEKLNITTPDLELAVVILESSHWMIDNNALLEIRLQFPYARVDPILINTIIRPSVIRLLKTRETLTRMHRQPINDWEDIISSTTNINPLLMYGSNKFKQRPKLVFTNIWPLITEDMLAGDIENIDINDAFVPTNHYDVQSGHIPSEILQSKDIYYWLPLFFSVKYWPVRLTERNKQSAKLEDNYEKITKRVLDSALTEYDVDVARAILFIYFVDPENIPNNYDPNAITTTLQYNTLKDVTSGNFFTWNKDTLIWDIFLQTTPGSHPKFQCFNYLISKYTNYRSLLSQQIHDSNDEIFKHNSETKIKNITSLIRKLKTIKYKAAYWNFVEESLSVNFIPSSNTITDELPLNDGKLYNIYTKKSRLRTPSDYYTYHLNARLNQEITSIKPNGNSPKAHHDAWNFIYDLMSHDEEKTLFLIKRLGIYISANLSDQSYMIWTGDTNNGQSTLLKYLKWLLGECCSPVAPRVFLESTTSQSDHLRDLKGLRLAYLCGVGPEKVISSANISNITGGDQLKTKEMYARTSENLLPKCHLILSTRQIPKFDISDQGLIKRTLVVNFRTFFRPVDCTYINPNSILVLEDNKLFMEDVLKKPEVANAFLTMLLLSFHEYTANYNIATIPEQVKLALNNHVDISFPYSDFISEVCVLGPDKYIHSARMYEYYSIYYGTRSDSSKRFVTEMTKQFHRRRKGSGSPFCYIGIDVNVQKLQEIINKRRTAHLTLNIIH